MLNQLGSKLTKRLGDPRNAIWYVVVVILVAITWSGAKAVQTNYGLQKQIAKLKQQNAVLQLQNENSDLTNQYLQSSQYEDLAARQSLGLAAPGETVLLVPQNVAMKYVNQSLTQTTAGDTELPKSPSQVVKNLEDWRDFVLGRTILSD